MTLKSLIEYVDRMKPNDFRYEDKIRWVNEFESLIQSAVFLTHPDDIIPYNADGEWKMEGVTFPDAHTMMLPKKIRASEYATVTVSGLETYSENNGEFVVRSVDGGGKVLMKYGEPFATDGTTPDVGIATIVVNNDDVELLLDSAFEHLYWYFLYAQIDYSNAEYDRYDNSYALFNKKYGEFCKWYTTHYPNRGC